jgi:hypothetical protein
LKGSYRLPFSGGAADLLPVTFYAIDAIYYPKKYRWLLAPGCRAI